MVYCKHCKSVYPVHGIPYICPVCGGLYDQDPWVYQVPDSANRVLPGIWRYRNSLNLPDTAPAISLGEGSTPLVWSNAFGRKVAFKCEFQNPTGSFKDRGSTTLVSFLAARQVTRIVEDSSGNAGASMPGTSTCATRWATGCPQ